ncbi:MAG TPA: hypothetical protein VF054_04775 [Micromonosporaceae bacterium]
MADVDFSGLRSTVENATRLPGFDVVERRARRIRRRNRLAVLSAVLATLAALGPAALLAPGPSRSVPISLGPDNDVTVTPDPEPSVTINPRVVVRAAAGVDIDHLYTAVDVCLEDRCNLQLSPVRPDGPESGPAKIGVLRDRPSDRLDAVRLVATGPSAAIVSGVDGGRRLYDRVDTSTAPAELGGVRAGQPSADERPAQFTVGGPVRLVDARTGRSRALPDQPPLGAPEVYTGLPATRGIWVTGIDPGTGEAAVAVSRDGTHWSVHRFGVRPGTAVPVLATHDGQVAYLFLTVGGVVREWRTVDGGTDWIEVPVHMSWPGAATGRFGAVVRPDGSVLCWLDGPPAPMFLTSTNGVNFTGTGSAGPSGPVVQVPGGYVALGERLALSRDGYTWSSVTPPYLVIGR